MIDVAWLIKGMILGFSIAAPVGPIGILCIRRTLSQGIVNGFAAGLGAATADAFYGSAAAFGLTLITTVLLEHSLSLHILGSIFLLYLGYNTFISKPAQEEDTMYREGWIKAYVSTLFLTITNPMTILSFGAVFAGLGVMASGENYLSSCLVVMGVFLGSSIWWLILSGTVYRLRDTFNYQGLLWVNRIAGILILGFGILSFWRLL
jgi:threonine/homoserine/homoserine lactone efflux protein